MFVWSRVGYKGKGLINNLKKCSTSCQICLFLYVARMFYPVSQLVIGALVEDLFGVSGLLIFGLAFLFFIFLNLNKKFPNQQSRDRLTLFMRNVSLEGEFIFKSYQNRRSKAKKGAF